MQVPEIFEREEEVTADLFSSALLNLCLFHSYRNAPVGSYR
jgi:hypothetical protein